MSIRRRSALPIRLAAAFALLLPVAGSAHVADLEAVLDTAQEVPAPTTTTATGTATFELEENGTVIAEVTFQGLTGAPTLAHIHQGAPGVQGGVVADFGSALAGVTGPAGTFSGEGIPALTPTQQQTLFSGGMYFNIHTSDNGDGEIRGQIRLKPGSCPCDGAASPGAFKSCVRQRLRQVPREERKEDSVKALRRLIKNAACGKTKTPKKAVACCLPINPAQNIVTQSICATVKAARCAALGGRNAGAGVACAPSPCGAS